MTPTKTDGIPVIEKSYDLSKLKRINGNRRLNPLHIRKLQEAISTNAETIKYHPILINEKDEIIDGQHRVEALKDLQLPVYFIRAKGLDLEDAQSLNKLHKPWSPVDYAKSYAELGNDNYQCYLDFKEKYRLNHDILMRYLALDNPITNDMFRAGKLQVKDIKASDDLCEKLISIGNYFRRYKNRSFALAFKILWSNDQYDHDRLLYKLEQRSDQIVDRALPEDYIRDLEAIYNHGLESADRLRFF